MFPASAEPDWNFIIQLCRIEILQKILKLPQSRMLYKQSGQGTHGQHLAAHVARGRKLFQLSALWLQKVLPLAPTWPCLIGG